MFLGLDIHKREAQVAVRDDDGTIIEETRVDNIELEALAERYAGGEAVLKATTNYYPIYETLSKHLDVVVGHPPKLKAIAESDTKTDRIDAKELSRLLWLALCPRVPSRPVSSGNVSSWCVAGTSVCRSERCSRTRSTPCWQTRASPVG